MPNCDMCGKDAPLYRALIEGTELRVCADCAKFGKVLAAPPRKPEKKAAHSVEKKQEIARKEIIQTVVPEYSLLIKSGREKLGLKQEEFAKKINEKESLIHKMESGSFMPSIELARKLERFLKVKLVEEEEVTELERRGKEKGSGTLTIGDMIKVK